MAKDGDTGRSDEPEDGGEGRRPETNRNGNDEESSVELPGGGTEISDLEVVALKFANSIHAQYDKNDVEEKTEVGKEAVDAEHDEDSSIIAGEVAQVVVDTALDFAEVGGLGNALEVEELGDGPQVGKT